MVEDVKQADQPAPGTPPFKALGVFVPSMAAAFPQQNGKNLIDSWRSRFRPSFAILFTVLGTTSFMVSCYLFHNGKVGDTALESEFRAKVDEEAYTWPMVAFGTAFSLNMLTLLFERESAKFQLALLTCYINFLAGMSDYLEWQGLATTIRGTWGHGIQIVRLIMYLHTTPAMVFLLSMVSDYPRVKVLKSMATDIGMLFFYVLAELCGSQALSVICYCCAYVLFAMLMNDMWHMFDASLSLPFAHGNLQSLLALRFFSVGLWVMFPILWCMTRLNILDINTEEWLWTAGDFLGKVIFSSSLLFGNFVTIEQRRMLAVRIVEEGHRVRVIQELQELVEQKESFMSSMSHELRTPLNGIIGLSDALLIGSCGDIGEKVQKTISTIKKSGSRLLTLVNDILDAASMKRGTLSVKHEKVDVAKVAEDVIDLCLPLAKRGVRLLHDMDGGLPPVLGDTGRIIQILHNLIGNSCKFTHKGYISIHARVKKELGMMEVLVVDTGIGIPEDKFQQVFQAFEQVDMSTTRKYGGTGLGLNLVKQLVEAHGGTIRVASTPGVKTTFTFTLKLWEEQKEKANEDADSAVSQAAPSEKDPMKSRLSVRSHHAPLRSQSFMNLLRKDTPSETGGSQNTRRARNLSRSSLQPSEAEEDSVVQTSTQPAAQNVPYKVATNISGPVSLEDALALASVKIPADRKRRRAHGENPKILSVDDDPVNQMVIQSLLDPAGYNLIQAMNGEEALELLTDPEDLPDAILLDVMMPGMSGYEVCRKLREMHPLSCIPVIMVSAKSKEEHIVEGLASGSNDYVVKPFGRAEILARIAAHIKFRDDAFQAAELAGEINALSRQAVLKINDLVQIESGLNSLPSTLVTTLEKNPSAIFQLPVFHSLTLVVFEVVNLEMMINYMNADELTCALTTLYWKLDLLLQDCGCYAVDGLLDSSTVVVAGLDGEKPEKHAANALKFARGILKAASEIMVLDNGHIEVSVGIHTAGSQGVVTGIKNPVLNIYGHLHERTCYLQATCPSGCIHVSQRTYDLIEDKTQLVRALEESPTETVQEMSYLVKAGSWEVNLPFMAACIKRYTEDYPNGPINYKAQRLRPCQLALLKLLNADVSPFIEVINVVSRLHGRGSNLPSLKDPGGSTGGPENGNGSRADAGAGAGAGDDALKLAREKKMLEQQLNEVTAEADRLQDEVDRLEGLLEKAQAAAESKSNAGEKSLEEGKAPGSQFAEQEIELTNSVQAVEVELKKRIEQLSHEEMELKRKIEQLTTACLLAEEHSAGLEEQLEVAIQQVTAFDNALVATTKERDELSKKSQRAESALVLLQKQLSLSMHHQIPPPHLELRDVTPMMMMPGWGLTKRTRTLPSRDASADSLMRPASGSESGRGPPSSDSRKLALLSEMGLTDPFKRAPRRLSPSRHSSFETRQHEFQRLVGMRPAAALSAHREEASGGSASSDGLEGQLARRFEELASNGAPLTIKQVLCEVGLGELAAQFEAEDVTPSLLPQMKEADLREVGATSIGAQMLLRLAGTALLRSGAI